MKDRGRLVNDILKDRGRLVNYILKDRGRVVNDMFSTASKEMVLVESC